MSVEHSIPTYRNIPGFPHYRFGDDGSIWSRHTKKPNQEFGKWRELGQSKSPAGYGVHYKRASLCENGEITTKRSHQWIAEAFYGPCPEGMEVCHNDGNGLNNRADNLRYDTRKGNMADTLAHGTRNSGTRNGQSKIQPDDVREIRKRAAAGETQESIASDFPISNRQVNRIVARKKWKALA